MNEPQPTAVDAPAAVAVARDIAQWRLWPMTFTSGSTTCRSPSGCRAASPRSHPAVERVAAAARAAGARLGLGGIGRAGQEDLPVPASLVYAQHARLGSVAALLSRSFLAGGRELGEEVRRRGAPLAAWRRRAPRRRSARRRARAR